MKILTVVLDLEKGGTQRAAQVFAEGYNELGHDSKILALYGLGSRYDEIKNLLEVYNGINQNTISSLKQWQPEILHIHSHGPKIEDINKILDILEKDSVKIIETNVFSKPTPWSEKLDCSLQLSNWCQWLYEKRGGENYPKAIVPNPIKCSAFSSEEKKDIEKNRKQYGIPNHSFVIGRIGQSDYANWSVRTIDIFDELHKLGYKPYLFLVSPPERIRTRINNSLNKNYIITKGFILGDEELNKAYSIIDVFIHIADIGESFGYVNAEAILSGVPSITFMTPWNSNSQGEVVKNNVGGHVVHHTDSAVELIKEYIDGKRTYDKEKGIQSIKDRFDYIKVCQLALKSIESSQKSKVITNSEIIELLNDSYDKPTLLTKLFFNLNLKILTRYSSGYESWTKLFPIIFNKLKNVLITRKYTNKNRA
ncbi:glycosyltransferase [Flavobacteriaceae bacterium]|nr:glycosyltransferase [Flavobacteriaceae bacterium]